MTLAEINKILSGRFDSEEDRAYWVEKKQELEWKEETIAENERYFKAMKKYDRL